MTGSGFELRHTTVTACTIVVCILFATGFAVYCPPLDIQTVKLIIQMLCTLIQLIRLIFALEKTGQAYRCMT